MTEIVSDCAKIKTFDADQWERRVAILISRKYLDLYSVTPHEEINRRNYRWLKRWAGMTEGVDKYRLKDKMQEYKHLLYIKVPIEKD